MGKEKRWRELAKIRKQKQHVKESDISSFRVFELIKDNDEIFSSQLPVVTTFFFPKYICLFLYWLEFVFSHNSLYLLLGLSQPLSYFSVSVFLSSNSLDFLIYFLLTLFPKNLKSLPPLHFGFLDVISKSNLLIKPLAAITGSGKTLQSSLTWD